MIDLEVLASGSRGNAAFVHLEQSNRLVLIDAGISPRRTRVAIQDRGLRIDRLDDIILTHADSDHLNPGWARALEQSQWSFVIHVHEAHIDAVMRAGIPRGRITVMKDSHALDEHTTVTACLAPHDVDGSATFVIDHAGVRLGWATDVGRIDAALLEHLRGVDALGIESNYDRSMQLGSGRPGFLVDRIMGGRGHLSNREALEAVRCIAQDGDLQHIVLLHLSEQCNCRMLVEELWAQEAGEFAQRVWIAAQRSPLKRIIVSAPQPCSS